MMADPKITIRLHDVSTNKPMKCKDVDSVKAVFTNLDTGAGLLVVAALKNPQGNDDPAVIEGSVQAAANILVGTAVEVTHKSGGKSSCSSIAAIVGPGSVCEFDCSVPPAEAAEKIANYVLKAHFCQRDPNGAVARGDEAEITKAWAERVSMTTKDGLRAGDNRVFHAIVKDCAANFALPTNATYGFYFETKKKRCSNPALTLHVCCEGKFEHDLCLTACERVVTAHLSDPCGKPISDPDAVVAEAEGGQVDATKPGTIVISGVEEGGRILFRSKRYEVSPDNHHVGKAMNQNVDLVVVPKTHVHATLDREEIIVTIDEELEPNEDALVKFLDADNVLVTTLKAESGKPVSYHAPRGQPLKIQLLVNGKVTDEAMYPSSE